jgi:hypothetical protein
MNFQRLEQYYGESLLIASVSFFTLALINEMGSIVCGGRSFDLFIGLQHLRALAPQETWPAICFMSGLFLKIWLLLLLNIIIPGSLIVWGLLKGVNDLPLPFYYLVLSTIIQIVFYANLPLRVKPRLFLAAEGTRTSLRFLSLAFALTYFWLSFGQLEFACWRQSMLYPLIEAGCGPRVAAEFLIAGLPSLKKEQGAFAFGRTALTSSQAIVASRAYFKAIVCSRQSFGKHCSSQVGPALALAYLSDQTGEDKYWPAIRQTIGDANLSVGELEAIFVKTFGFANAYDYLANKALRLKDFDLAQKIIERGVRAHKCDSAGGGSAMLFSLYATELRVMESRGASAQCQLALIADRQRDLQKILRELAKQTQDLSVQLSRKQIEESLPYFAGKKRELARRVSLPGGSGYLN